MNPEGDQGVGQSGLILQDVGTMSPRNSKRCRDESEEERHPADLGIDSQCGKAADLNLSTDVVPSDGGREDQDNLTVFQSEKRIKCGPCSLENDSRIPISSTVNANENIVALDGGDDVIIGLTNQNVSQECAAAMVKVSDKVAELHSFGIKRGTQFRCDICSVKSTSAKDLETHLAGKRHARAIVKNLFGGSKSEVHTPQIVQGSTEDGCTHLNSNSHTTSMRQLVLADGSGEASKGFNSSGTNMGKVIISAPSSKCPDLNDAEAVHTGQHSSMDCSFRDFLMTDPPSKVGCDGQHHMNGAVHNPTLLTDGFLEKICGQVGSEGEPYKCLVASLSAKSHSDCVAQALASVLSTYGCPELGDVQEGSPCGQATECSGSQLGGAKSPDNDGMVTMHTRCFSNLLHDVHVSVLEDLIWHGGLKTNSRLPNAAPISALAPSGEDLNCSVCRVEYGSRADLDLHLAGRKHASLVQRVSSRCQLCNLNCNTERDFKTHLTGKKHASKLRLVRKRVTF